MTDAELNEGAQRLRSWLTLKGVSSPTPWAIVFDAEAHGHGHANDATYSRGIIVQVLQETLRNIAEHDRLTP